MQMSGTHFEQIPVQKVKQIVEKDGKKKTQLDVPPRKTERYNIGISRKGAAACGTAKNGDLKYPEWQEPFRDALLEVDPNQFKPRVAAAETAIFDRLQALTKGREHQAERQAIEDALNSLQVLKRDRLYSPDWEIK